MSVLHRMRGGRSVMVVSGTLTGSGTLSIPQGVTLVTLTGRGGNGGNNYWYTAPQAGVGYHPEVLAQAAVWTWVDDGTFNMGVFSGAGYDSYPHSDSTGPSGTTTGYDTYTVWATFGDTTSYNLWRHSYHTVETSAAVSYRAAYWDTPPVLEDWGGGPYTGTSTTSTLNGVTRTWAGGYDSGGVGTTSDQALVSTGAGQSMTYSVPGTGALTYTYEI